MTTLVVFGAKKKKKKKNARNAKKKTSFTNGNIFFTKFLLVHNCTKGNNDIATKGDLFTQHCYSLFYYLQFFFFFFFFFFFCCFFLNYGDIVSATVYPSVRHVLLLNQSAKFKQTCYITSLHGEVVREQHYFSLRLSVRQSSVHLSVTLSP